jgi:hypothetical protein
MGQMDISAGRVIRFAAGQLAAGSLLKNFVAKSVAANLAAAACVGIAILLPGSTAISEPGLQAAGEGISRPPKGNTFRLFDRTPLGKGDRLQLVEFMDQDEAPQVEAAAPKDCDPDGTIAYWFEHGAEPSCPDKAQNDSIEADRAYLVETASPGYTMTRQGPELAIGRLNPEFVRRLAASIREARQAGLSSAGIFSAYRPPAFGVGGFSNKFNSLHTYGLAVDMTGIGGPASAEAKSWHEIAARHGVVCPYGSASRTEWNHCQPTAVKIILTANPLRETVTAEGPVNLDSMFEAGTALIESSAGEEPGAETEHGHGFRLAGTMRVVMHLGCKHGHHAEACGGSHQTVAAKNHEAGKTHSRQAAVKSSRESRKL